MLENIKAIIFDMDGTLIDSTGIWEIIDRDFFKTRGLDVPKTYADDIAHIGLKEAAIYTKEKFNIKESIEEIQKEWEMGAVNQYLHIIPLKECVKEYLDICKEKGIKMAIATANRDTLYIPCLKRLGIYDYFEVISDVEKVGKGKESSLLFDYVADKLNIPKNQIAVFEDSVVGLKTAKEAGYVTVAVYDKSSEKYDDTKKNVSDYYIKSFNELI